MPFLFHPFDYQSKTERFSMVYRRVPADLETPVPK